MITMKHHLRIPLHRALALCLMAVEGEEEATPGGTITELAGGAVRVTPEAKAPAVDPALETPPAETTEAGLPEGFDSWEAFGKAQLAKETATTEEPAKDAPKPGTPEEAVSQALEGISDDMRPKVEPFVKAFAETGTLTDEQISQAAKDTGLSPAMIRQYMAGAEAESLRAQAGTAAEIAPFHAVFGGETEYADFGKWAETGLTEQEQAAYNRALDHAPEAALLLAEGFKARMAAEGAGAPARDITRETNGSNAQTAKGYTSKAEMTKDMSDPRYNVDRGYTEEVMRKVGAATFDN